MVCPGGGLHHVVRVTYRGNLKSCRVPGELGLSANPSVVSSVSCTGLGDCTAGGAYQSVFEDDEITDSAYVMSEVNGKWGTGEMVPGTAALNTALGAATTAVSCSSPGNCAAVGYYAYSYGDSKVGTAEFVASQVNGVWGTARAVPALSSAVPGLSTAAPGSAVTTVSCPFRGTCGIGGYYAGKSRHQQAFVASEVKGTWTKAAPVPGAVGLNGGGDAAVTSVSCTAVGGCAAAGTYQPVKGPGQLFVVLESCGGWHAGDLGGRRHPGVPGG